MAEVVDDTIPWHWDKVTLLDFYSGNPIKWCGQQGWLPGVDYYFIITDPHPMYTTEWGRFNINKGRVYNYLFKDPKHATIFRLRWI